MSKPVIGIAGFGIEGKALHQHFKDAATLHIFDEAPLSSNVEGAVFHQGFSIPAEISVLYKSPGIPSRKITLASSATRVTTLADLVLGAVGERAVGVTGTKGKSTVASLVHHILIEAGRDSVLFGNIGVADLEILDEDGPDRTYVIELSSYQLEHVAHSPHIAVFTNFFQEHLAHHGSLDAYREAKLNIARFQHPGDLFIDGSGLGVSFIGMRTVPDFSRRFETKLPGEHNQRNAALAFAAAVALGVPENVALRAIATFEPLPYRLENIGTYGGVTFYDDSLATVPEATLASLAALPRVDTLILGGEDRGMDFGPFAEALKHVSVSTFIAFPDTGEKMVAQLKDKVVVPVSTMEEAVRVAYERTPKGGTALLSNASPSFNLFKDYKDKSAQYRSWVLKCAPKS